jgi:phosphatidylserine decarboxylase
VELGGFGLGSSIVLVFEAPAGDQSKKGEKGGKVKGGWIWNVEKGQRVKVGEALGWVEDE